MQLELPLSESPAATLMPWDQLDPVVRQAVIDRLALALAKTVLAPTQDEESGDE